ncbi:MAG: hypothetical protein R3330_13205, partial [Saprospiraceae bacterium]|nr:hypothetical protein [Saprospiraceae bacterium]
MIGIVVLVCALMPMACNQDEPAVHEDSSFAWARSDSDQDPLEQARILRDYLASFGGVLRTELALTLNCPPDVSVECLADVLPAYTIWSDFLNAGGTGSSACGLDTTTFAVNEVVSGSCPTTITRTYQIDDSCAVTFTCMQTITVDDVTDPVITACPIARNLEGCSTADISGPAFSTVSAASSISEFQDATNQGSAGDGCGIASVAYMDVASGACPITVTRTWTITDTCGNTATCDQTITVNDTTDPVISACAVARTIEGCSTADISGPSFSTVSAASTESEFENGTNQGSVSDACGVASVSYIDVA